MFSPHSAQFSVYSGVFLIFSICYAATYTVQDIFLLIPQNHSDVQLNEITPQLITETEKQMDAFKKQNLSWFPIEKIDVSFPWNRMFEVKIKLQ